MEEIVAGRYKLVKPLGQGSFGQVYLSEDLRVGGLRVIKLSALRLVVQENDTFKREASASATLEHPNIGRVYDFGITDDNRSYIVREYVDGPSLEDILHASGVTLIDALRITRAIAAGLSEAHGHNIIHRDLKPSNVVVPIVDGRPDFDRSKILDFGVFGRLFDRGDEPTTMVGEIYGTPLYMAPEQLLGEEQSTATDIYGLSVLLYQMLYGRLPFEGNSIVELMRAKAEGRVDFPGDDVVPSEIVSFLRRSLTSERTMRVRTADEVIALVDRTISSLESLKTDDIPLAGIFLDRPKELVAPGAAPEMLQQTSPAMRSVGLDLNRPSSSPLLMFVLGFFLLVAIGGISGLLWSAGFLSIGLIFGALLVTSGVGASIAFKFAAKKKQTEVGKSAQELLFGSKSRDVLTESLAVQVNTLLTRISREDDRILGMSLALMVREFQETEEPPHRQNALMNVVILLEKISARLSPWYVRHDKLVAVIVALVGVISGITTITLAVVNTMKGK